MCDKREVGVCGDGCVDTRKPFASGLLIFYAPLPPLYSSSLCSLTRLRTFSLRSWGAIHRAFLLLVVVCGRLYVVQTFWVMKFETNSVSRLASWHSTLGADGGRGTPAPNFAVLTAKDRVVGQGFNIVTGHHASSVLKYGWELLRSERCEGSTECVLSRDQTTPWQASRSSWRRCFAQNAAASACARAWFRRDFSGPKPGCAS